MITVEVVYASLEKQLLISLVVADNCTVGEAVQQSGILQQFPEINLENIKVGIFSKLIKLDQKLQPGDRVEIYRPLKIDPKQARLLRAAKKLKK